MSDAAAVTRHRQKRRQELIKIMGGKCAICGYDKNIAALELHHLDPNQKDYGLSSGNCKSIEQDIEEVKKCILVCANCHREIHSGEYQEQLKSSFQQDIAEEILQTYQKNVRIEKFCPLCGKKIQYSSNHCNDCNNLLKRMKNLETRPSRQELKNLIRTLPFTQIGQKFGVTDNAIRKWCDGYNLPRTKKEINNFSNDQWKKI